MDPKELAELRKAAEQGDPKSQTLYSAQLMEENPQDPKALAEARLWMGKAAEQGFAPAQFSMGQILASGIGGEQDYKAAEAWLWKAAEKGLGAAYMDLGRFRFSGIGGPVDNKEGNRLWRLAAEHGDDNAQLILGIRLYRGEGMPVDKVESLAWLDLAIARGNEDAPNAAAEIAEQLEDAQIVAALKRASELATQVAKTNPLSPERITPAVLSRMRIITAVAAAKKGDLPSQRWLVDTYTEGVIIARDLEKRARWLTKAAEQGDAESQVLLSLAYKFGHGVPKDTSQVVSWVRKAAMQGNAQAQNNLGDCYENGTGLAKDIVEAHAWYRLAKENGDKVAIIGIGSTEKLMTTEQLAVAGRRLAELRKEVASGRPNK